MTLAIVLYLLIGVVVLVASQWHPDWATRSTMRESAGIVLIAWPAMLLFLGSWYVERWLRRIGRDREREP